MLREYMRRWRFFKLLEFQGSPGSVGDKAINQSQFPVDLFQFTTPSADSPTLYVRDGWDFEVNGCLTATDMTKVRAYQSTSQTINDLVLTKILFQTEDFDITDEFADSRLTIVKDGYYFLHTQVDLVDLPDTKTALLYFKLNGNTIAVQWVTSSLTTIVTLQLSTFRYLEADDYIEVYVYHGHDPSVDTSNSTNSTFFEAYRIP